MFIAISVLVNHATAVGQLRHSPHIPTHPIHVQCRKAVPSRTWIRRPCCRLRFVNSSMSLLLMIFLLLMMVVIDDVPVATWILRYLHCSWYVDQWQAVLSLDTLLRWCGDWSMHFSFLLLSCWKVVLAQITFLSLNCWWKDAFHHNGSWYLIQVSSSWIHTSVILPLVRHCWLQWPGIMTRTLVLTKLEAWFW